MNSGRKELSTHWHPSTCSQLPAKSQSIKAGISSETPCKSETSTPKETKDSEKEEWKYSGNPYPAHNPQNSPKISPAPNHALKSKTSTRTACFNPKDQETHWTRPITGRTKREHLPATPPTAKSRETKSENYIPKLLIARIPTVSTQMTSKGLKATAVFRRLTLSTYFMFDSETKVVPKLYECQGYWKSWLIQSQERYRYKKTDQPSDASLPIPRKTWSRKMI